MGATSKNPVNLLNWGVGSSPHHLKKAGSYDRQLPHCCHGGHHAFFHRGGSSNRVQGFAC
jgi:hypothetical protein